MESTDPSLIGRAKCGEEAAWASIAEIYSPFIEFWLRKWGVSELEDIRQDVLVRAWRGLKNFQLDTGGSFRGWLLVITRNTVRDHIVKAPPAVGRGGSVFAAHLAQLPESALYEEADSQFPESAEIELMRRAVLVLKSQLSSNAWKIFWESAVCGRTAPEIASELQMTAMAVRKTKSRAVRQLRQLLAGIVPEEAVNLV